MHSIPNYTSFGTINDVMSRGARRAARPAMARLAVVHACRRRDATLHGHVRQQRLAPCAHVASACHVCAHAHALVGMAALWSLQLHVPGKTFQRSLHTWPSGVAISSVYYT